MLDNSKLASNIKKFRIKNKLTQTELAEKIFVSCQAVSKWERGLTIPELDKVCLLAEIFSISINELVGSNRDNTSYMIGIDGGGSKTEFILFDENGKVYERITLGGCNPNTIGIEASVKILTEGINNLILIKQNIKGIYIGASGFKTGNNGEKIGKLLLKEYPYVKIKCSTDIFNVIAASGIKENCIAAICGTGTVVYSVIDNELVSYTGWGYLFDKGGSGYHIGRDGITAALEAADSLGDDTLIKTIIEENLQSDIKDNIKNLYDKGQAYIASMASAVFKAYEAGDKVALDILTNNAKRTAFVINKVKEINPKVSKVILSGSIFVRDNIYIGLVEKYLNKDLDIITVELLQVYGAAILCGEMCGIDVIKLYKAFKNQEGL